jgi:hypothetical protein
VYARPTRTRSITHDWRVTNCLPSARAMRHGRRRAASFTPLLLCDAAVRRISLSFLCSFSLTSLQVCHGSPPAHTVLVVPAGAKARKLKDVSFSKARGQCVNLEEYPGECNELNMEWSSAFFQILVGSQPFSLGT